jgi:hypothetical protein
VLSKRACLSYTDTGGTMTKSVEAVFDGVTLHPDEPLGLPPNTRVRLTIESLRTVEAEGSFLRTARTLGLSGPRDWSSNLETYLYGENAESER